MSNDDWLSMSAEENAADSLREAVTQLKRTGQNVAAWKPSLLALHAAIYGFAVCASRGTTNEGVVEVRLAADGSPLEGRLVSFTEALARCGRKKVMDRVAGARLLVLSEAQRKVVKALNGTYRNRFTHFQPGLWSFDVAGMRVAARHGLEVVGQLLRLGAIIHLTVAQHNDAIGQVDSGLAFLNRPPGGPAPVPDRAVWNEIRQWLAEARIYLDLWRVLEVENPDHAMVCHVLNEYRLFGVVLAPTFWKSFVTKFAAVLDRNDDSLSIWQLPGIDRKANFDVFEERARRLYRYRSKVIAHRNREVTTRSFAAETEFSADILTEMIEEACNRFDDAGSQHNEPPVPRLSAREDFLALVADAKKGRWPGAQVTS